MNKSLVTIVGTTVVVASVVAATLPHHDNTPPEYKTYEGVSGWAKYWILGSVGAIKSGSVAAGHNNEVILQDLQAASKNADSSAAVSDKLKQALDKVNNQNGTLSQILDTTNKQVVRGLTLVDLTTQNHSYLSQALSGVNGQMNAVVSLNSKLGNVLNTLNVIVQGNKTAEQLLVKAAQLSQQAANEIALQ